VSTRSNTPVFCDESGVRSVVMQWGGRGLGLLLILLLCAGLALTLATRVEVPGLSRLHPGAGGGRSELFDAPARWAGLDRQVADEGKVLVAETSEQTVVRVRHSPDPRPSWAAPTVEPVAERPAVTRAQPTATSATPATTASATPSAQSSPTEEPNPTTGPRNLNAAVPRENPNAQGPPVDPAGQAKGRGNSRAVGAPSPVTEAEPTTS
jgi:hypothetical protein